MSTKIEGTATDYQCGHSDAQFKIWVLLHHTVSAMEKARQKELRQYGLNNMQSGILYSVSILGEMATPAEISRWLLREPQTITSHLNRMERAGLVKKVKDLKRKNLVRVAITEKGQRAYYDSTKRKAICKIVSSLSKEEQQQLRSCLKILRKEALSEIGYSAPRFPKSQLIQREALTTATKDHSD